MAARFKALADPVRIATAELGCQSAGGEACVCDISAGVEVSQPTISHHLKVLRDAGLLTSRRRASWVYYAVVPEALTVLSNLLSVHADAAPPWGHRHDGDGHPHRRPGGGGQTLDAGPLLAGVDRVGNGRRATTGPVDSRPAHRPRRGSARRDFAADRARPADHDVSGAGQGALRPPRHRHR
ncbi:ArsR family transcriptional regulator [Mycobacterium tuberculosis CAS/NITR204]|uniref:ArsR family transcriptional regulator n=1 Tax=Mycobacterium tuberculosis CAS/NITR204 TaxID=1310114 RepID=R4MKT9_MYCTX|nr:ArsR family transcriptional regulator [Mycobacterium tuberculosis CAS/NITR204]